MYIAVVVTSSGHTKLDVKPPLVCSYISCLGYYPNGSATVRKLRKMFSFFKKIMTMTVIDLKVGQAYTADLEALPVTVNGNRLVQVKE